MNSNTEQTVLNIQNLDVSYYTRAGEIPAVVDFSLEVKRGETIGLVGESGCGKSTVAMAIMQFMGNNGLVKSGSIEFKGRDMTKLSEEELRQIRGKEISMIYQEPFSALNPSMSVGNQLMEVPLAHENIRSEEALRAGSADSRRRKHSRSGASPGLLSASTVWRPAATSCYSNGTVVQTRPSVTG